LESLEPTKRKRTLSRDKDSTVAMYGTDHTTTELLTGKVPVPTEAHAVVVEVRRGEYHYERASK